MPRRPQWKFTVVVRPPKTPVSREEKLERFARALLVLVGATTTKEERGAA